MKLSLSRKLQSSAGMLLALLASSGCVINAELTVTPDPVIVGQPVTMKVKATNPLQCPVGGVVGFLFPFVPKDHLISQIEDEELREELSEAVDQFCAGGDLSTIIGDVDCELDDGELVCTMGIGSMSPQEALALATTASGNDVTCASTGTRIICRIPAELVQLGNDAMGQSGTSGVPLPFECNQVDGIVVCGTLALGPGQMKMDEVQLTAQQAGMFRNFLVIIATHSGGVCKTGLVPSLPCSVDSQCFDPPGMPGPECGSGMCSGGRTGFGCDADADCTTAGVCIAGSCITGNIGADCTINADCAATGTCVDCDPGDGEFLPGLACSSSVVIGTAVAPAMSPWSMVLVTAGLLATATVTLRRVLRAR